MNSCCAGGICCASAGSRRWACASSPIHTSSHAAAVDDRSVLLAQQCLFSVYFILFYFLLSLSERSRPLRLIIVSIVYAILGGHMRAWLTDDDEEGEGAMTAAGEVAERLPHPKASKKHLFIVSTMTRRPSDPWTLGPSDPWRDP